MCLKSFETSCHTCSLVELGKYSQWKLYHLVIKRTFFNPFLPQNVSIALPLKGVQNLLLMGCSGLVHTCKLQVCNCAVKKSAGGRLASLLEKRLDFHPSDATLNLAGGKDNHPKVIPCLAWDGFQFSGLFPVSSTVAVTYRIHCQCGCELLSHWQVFTESNSHIDIKVMACIYPFQR